MNSDDSFSRNCMNRFLTLCSFALMMLFTPLHINAATVTLLDDTFDNENGGAEQLNFSMLTNWNVIDGSVDLLGNGGMRDFYPGNGLYLDLDGTSSNAGTLESKTTFSFQQNDSVTLSFDLAGPCDMTNPAICSGFPAQNMGNNEVTVSLGSLINETFSRIFDEPFQTITRTISINSLTSGTLIFDHLGSDNIGLILDNVKLTVENSTPVPAPSTIGLFTTGLIGLGFFRWLHGRRSTANLTSPNVR